MTREEFREWAVANGYAEVDGEPEAPIASEGEPKYFTRYWDKLQHFKPAVQPVKYFYD